MKFIIFSLSYMFLLACSNEAAMNGGSSGRSSASNTSSDATLDDVETFGSLQEEDTNPDGERGDEEVELFPPGEENDDVEITEITIGFNYGDKVKKDGKDDDWNDGVVCISGKYRVNYDKGTVLSMEDQSVDLSYRDGSGATVDIFVEGIIGNPDNPASRNTIIDYGGDGGSNGPLLSKNYNFKRGELIRVTFNKPDFNVAYAPFKNNVDPVAVRLLKDVCNLTGN